METDGPGPGVPRFFEERPIQISIADSAPRRGVAEAPARTGACPSPSPV